MESKLIFKKMSQIMADILPVEKSQTNKLQNYKFRGIDQFVNALNPALVKHGVFIVPECVSESHEIRTVVRKSGDNGVDKHVNLSMKYHFYAEDGSSVSVGPIPSEGIDTSDKATNKALSAALKYMLIQTFAVPTEDMTDADSDHVPISKGSGPTEYEQYGTTNMSASGGSGDYVCQLKKYKGIPLKDIPTDELINYCKYLVQASETEGKGLSGMAKDLVEHARTYIKELHSGTDKNLN